ncbi:MAG: primosomal protein N' [Caldilineaceae bacterium]
MVYAEIVVNVPLRRTFARRYQSASPDDEDMPPGANTGASATTSNHLSGEDDGSGALQAFHYHLPPDLESIIQPGHLVWVPFGNREVQGFVVGLTNSAPVETRAVLRLARPDPVLTDVQLALAGWIADYYVAPASETLRLFLPPGLLSRGGKGPSVRAKREELIFWTGGDEDIDECLSRLGRDTYASRALTLLVELSKEALCADEPFTGISARDLRTAVRAQNNQPIHGLVDKGYAKLGDDERLLLAGAPEEARQAVRSLRGVEKYVPVIEFLARKREPVWKSDLYAAVHTNLAVLRSLVDAGLISISEHVRFRDPLRGAYYAPDDAPALTEEQSVVWDQLDLQGFQRLEDGSRGKGRKFLIHGVTGSGKTEIYLRAIAKTLSLGQQAIVLVPEIALTPQTVKRFAGRFPGRVTVIHSGLSSGERYDVWREIRKGAYDIVVGARSALFAPLPRLGLVVLDEEHEPSYKQDAEEWGSYKVFYDARSTAMKLTELCDGVLLLGSATPSLDRYYEAKRGSLKLLHLPHRVMGHSATAGARYLELPPVEVVDMRQELRADNRSVLSRSLQSELLATLNAQEQAILFLNRRGTNSFVLCRDCGSVLQCTRCDTPLTYHDRAAVLICHQCNRRYPIPETCPKCGSKRIKYFGAGTQRIEDAVKELAPSARVLRWDADTTRAKGSHQQILEEFAGHQADVLVGTQMIAKGLDLPLVTLVGVVAADVALHMPDFRSGERTFQLLTQVAGRAGRGTRDGRVVVQTYNPEHYAIQAAAAHDYHAFYRQEIGYRRDLGYPPIQRMARLILWEANAEKAQQMSEEMAERLRRRTHAFGLTAENHSLVGPAPAYFARVRGRYRWQIVLRCDDPSAVLRGMVVPFGWRIDIDPVSVL